MNVQPVFGDQLRQWRQRRRLSQMDLALDSEISTRHLSFLETGRAQPSREMVLRLAEQLGTPLRDRNRLLVAAGFAPIYSERSLDDPEMTPIRQAVDLILQGHRPHPALAFNADWDIVAANDAIIHLLDGLDPGHPELQGNIARIALHPAGLASRILNLAEFRRHLVHRLQSQVAATGNERLKRLLVEISTYPDPPSSDTWSTNLGQIAVPMRLMSAGRVLSFISATTVFGSATDIILSELALESFFPADEETAAYLLTNAIVN